MRPQKSGFNQKQYNQPTDKQKRERLEAAMRRVNTNLYPKTNGGKNG